MPVYDGESMNVTAEALERLADEVRTSRENLKGLRGQSPFGDVAGPQDPDDESDTVAGTLGSFTQGMHTEFDAAIDLISNAGGVLRDAAAAMSETDAAAAESLTWQEAE